MVEVSSFQRQTQKTHNTDNAATLPSAVPLPFLSGVSKPVPPEGYRETSVGTGQLLAVSSVISYICPSIGCRCQFRPNRCMAVVSNGESHLFLLEVEMELPKPHGEGSGWGNGAPKATGRGVWSGGHRCSVQFNNSPRKDLLEYQALPGGSRHSGDQGFRPCLEGLTVWCC